LFQESKQYLSIPRGLEDEIRGIATKTVWENKTIQGTPLHAVFNGELRPNQQAAYQALLRHQNGILSARTGFGKTVIAARLIAKRAVSTLILVKNKTLAEQWYQRLTTFLRINDDPVITELTPSGRQRRKKVIGSYYGSKKNRSGLVDIATTQSLSRLKPKELTRFLAAYGMVISDEVHHDSASTFDAVIQQVSSSYLYGLSATPYRRDGHEPIIMMRFGPIRYHTEAIDPVYAKTVHRVVIPRFTNLGMTNLEMLNNGRTENNQAIMNDPQRDKMIIRDCKNALKENRHTIVLTNLVAHVDQLYNQLPEEQTFRIYGGFSAKQRAEEVQKIESYVGPYVILATVSTAGEGLDVPTLDTLILTMPISYHGNVEQVVGRLHRDLAHKSELRIYDYVDMFVPMMMRMYRKRRKAYKHLEYEISEDQYSRQKGLQVFDGHYQVALLAGVKEATQLLIVAPKLKSYLKQLVQRVIGAGGEVQIYTQAKRDESLSKAVKWTQFDHNLPNCVIIDERQLWFSADSGFGYDRGMTIRLDHPELIQNFKKMLIQTMSEF
jgi:superfamily II DNA or RNA helicase